MSETATHKRTGKPKIVKEVEAALERDKPIYVKLPGNGTLVMDQLVPFLLVYRLPPGGKDEFTKRLGKTEAAYIIGSNAKTSRLHNMVEVLSTKLADKFGGFLLLEVWFSNEDSPVDFTIHVHRNTSFSVADKLNTELSRITVGMDHFSSKVEKGTTVNPPYYKSILPKEQLKKSEILLIGLEIKPRYMNTHTGKPYPLFLRALRIAFSKALKKTFFEFIRLHTSFNAGNFEMLGKTVIEDKVWEIDAQLADFNAQFDLLFLVTPVNVTEAWEKFKESNYLKEPVFHYRHMPIDPELIKRNLYALPIEDISDPTLAFLFRDKRKEIDRMLNMLAEREKEDFVQSSIQLFGRIDDKVLEIAKALLIAVPLPKPKADGETINARQFAALAKTELQYLKKQYDEVQTEVKVRDDIVGILVSKGVLHINTDFTVHKKRIPALLQHEIGTHVATYFNGRSQPFKLFSSGVPGYEQLQEGLAVLIEYIMDGLTGGRLRTLAARVVAVDQMVAGHSFCDTFHLLVDHYHFSPERAFNIVMRVYRGGGLTKDAVYLKGLINVLDYIRAGNDLEPLLIGKIRQDYLPFIDELIHRRLLRPIPIKPRYLNDSFKEKIHEIKERVTLFNMTAL
jgi:uncharacterized protein (TIGR02421 family)